MSVSSLVVDRIKGEFREMPGLKLTPAQASRLFGLGRQECDNLFDLLTGIRFLARTRDGAYVRAAQGA